MTPKHRLLLKSCLLKTSAEESKQAHLGDSNDVIHCSFSPASFHGSLKILSFPLKDWCRGGAELRLGSADLLRIISSGR
jgi:hypothetical protein